MNIRRSGLIIGLFAGLLAIPFGASFAWRPAPDVKSIGVSAGPFDRRNTVVSFMLPQGKATSYTLRDEKGAFIALQVDETGRASFILQELKANQTRTYQLIDRRNSAKGAEAIRAGAFLKLRAEGREILSYRADEGEQPPQAKPVFRRGGYIHPVHSPSGVVISDDYPPNHWHHHGVWFAWTNTEFEGRKPDFWNVADGTGRVDFVALDKSWSGPVHAGFRSRQRYIALGGGAEKTALNEVWEVAAYAGQTSQTMFDLTATQECASASPLVLPEYRYGGMGFRGHRQWDGKDNAVFLTSEGKGRIDGHATRARWCRISGRIDGKWYSIAILDHPDNFRAPQPMRIHPTEPFFNFAPSQMGEWRITPGQPYISRYRYVAFDGQPESAELDRLWNDYAKPPQVNTRGK